MRNSRNLFVGMLSCVVGMVGLLSVGRAEAELGGLPACQAKLATCTSNLGNCQTDLEACEEAPSVVFPGDGVTGPALSYTDNGDGTITDNNTQLIWEKKDEVEGSIHNVDNTYQWSSSGTAAADGSLFTTFLATLNTVPCFAGYCDWRISNVRELQSLVDYSTYSPAVNGAFPGPTGAHIYWSSTSYAAKPDEAWAVSFTNGAVGNNGSTSGLYRARAVRGGS